MIERIARALCRAEGVNPDRMMATVTSGVNMTTKPARPYAWELKIEQAQAVLTELSAGDGVQECDRAIADQYWQRGCQDHDALSQTVSEVRTLAAATERARRDKEIVERLRKRHHHPRCCVVEGRDGQCACSINRDEYKHDLRIADAIEAGEV